MRSGGRGRRRKSEPSLLIGHPERGEGPLLPAQILGRVGVRRFARDAKS